MIYSVEEYRSAIGSELEQTESAQEELSREVAWTNLIPCLIVGPIWYPPGLAHSLGYDLALRRMRPGVEHAAVYLSIAVDDGRLSLEELGEAIDDFVDRAAPYHGAPADTLFHVACAAS